MAQCPNVTLYGIQIPSFQTVKYLRLQLDRRLTWSQLNNRPRTLGSLLHRNTHTSLNIKLILKNIVQNPSKTHLDLRAPALGQCKKIEPSEKFPLKK